MENPSRALIFPYFLCAFAVSTGTFVFIGLLGPMSRDLMTNVSSVAQLQTVFLMASAIVGPLVVRVGKKLAPQTILLFSLLVLTASNVFCALSTILSGLLFARFLGGAAGGVVLPMALTLALTSAPPNDGRRVVSQVTLGTTLAFLIGVPVGSLLGDSFGWRATFGFAAVLSTLAFCTIAAQKRGGVTPEVTAPAKPAETSAAVQIIVVLFLAFVAVFCTTTFIRPIVEALFNDPTASPALFQGIIGLGSVLGIFLSVYAVRVHLIRFQTIGLVFLVCAQLGYAALLSISPSALGASTALSILIFTSSTALFAFVVVAQKNLAAVSGSQLPFFLSLSTSAIFLGQAAGSALGGMVIWFNGIEALGLAGAAVAGIGLMLVWNSSTSLVLDTTE